MAAIRPLQRSLTQTGRKLTVYSCLSICFDHLFTEYSTLKNPTQNTTDQKTENEEGLNRTWRGRRWSPMEEVSLAAIIPMFWDDASAREKEKKRDKKKKIASRLNPSFLKTRKLPSIQHHTHHTRRLFPNYQPGVLTKRNIGPHRRRKSPSPHPISNAYDL